MAIFGFKKRNDDKAEQAATVSKGVVKPRKIGKPAKAAQIQKAAKPTTAIAVTNKIQTVPAGVFSASAGVIIRPRVTEKSGLLSQGGVYTFEVARDANKQSVRLAIRTLYKVTPTKVAMVNMPGKNVFVKGRKGQVAGMKKAVITVKKGEKIDFV